MFIVRIVRFIDLFEVSRLVSKDISKQISCVTFQDFSLVPVDTLLKSPLARQK